MTASVAVPLQATGPIRGAAVRALFALAIGAFGIGMTEFVVMGLLPDLAADLLTSHFAADPEAAIAQTGWLISFYALGVVIGAPTISGFRRKTSPGLSTRNSRIPGSGSPNYPRDTRT